MDKRISDSAVKKATGKNWVKWFTVLNRTGAKEMEHKEVARLLYSNYGLSGWWSQMVTVQYEQDVKGRKKHEKQEGYQISKSKTLPFSVSKIFTSVQSSSARKNWLKDPDIKITTSTKNKSIRAKWIDGTTNIEIQFYSKDKLKTQFVVQHNKIHSAREAERLIKYWEKQLSNLKNYLEKKKINNAA